MQKLPENCELQFHLGSAYVLSGKFYKGLALLQSSLKNYNDRKIYLSLSLGCLRTGNHIKAEKHAKRALAMFPDHLAPHLLLGQIYFKTGQYEKSRAELQKCINEETSRKSEKTAQIKREAQYLWQIYYSK